MKIKDVPKERIIPSFKELNRQQKQAVLLKSQGATYGEIQRATKAAPATVARWFGPEGTLLPALDEHLATLSKKMRSESEKLHKEVYQEIQSKAKWAFKQMVKLAKDDKTPKHVRANLLDSIMDRAGFPRVQKSENSTEIKTLTKADREDMFSSVLKLVKNNKKANSA